MNCDVDKIAQALYRCEYPGSSYPWDGEYSDTKDDYRALARVAVETICGTQNTAPPTASESAQDDLFIRRCALDAAIAVHKGYSNDARFIIAEAEKIERYLRGEK